MKRVPMEVTAGIHDGDYDRQYVTVRIGAVEVTLYESEVRPGGVTIDIDAEDTDVSLLSVTVNDWEINRGEGS